MRRVLLTGVCAVTLISVGSAHDVPCWQGVGDDFWFCMFGPGHLTPCTRWLDWACLDADYDGDIDLRDFAALQNNWGNFSAPG